MLFSLNVSLKLIYKKMYGLLLRLGMSNWRQCYDECFHLKKYSAYCSLNMHVTLLTTGYLTSPLYPTAHTCSIALNLKTSNKQRLISESLTFQKYEELQNKRGDFGGRITTAYVVVHLYCVVLSCNVESKYTVL